MSKESRTYIKEQIEYVEGRMDKAKQEIDEISDGYNYWKGYHDALKWSLRWVAYEKK